MFREPTVRRFDTSVFSQGDLIAVAFHPKMTRLDKTKPDGVAHYNPEPSVVYNGVISEVHPEGYFVEFYDGDTFTQMDIDETVATFDDIDIIEEGTEVAYVIRAHVKSLVGGKK